MTQAILLGAHQRLFGEWEDSFRHCQGCFETGTKSLTIINNEERRHQMPFRVDPTSHSGRADLLYRAIQSAASDRIGGREYAPQEWIDQATAFLQVYRPKVDVITREIGARAIEVRERDVAIGRLSTYVRHGWQVLKMRVERLGQPEGVLRFYSLPLEGVVPRGATPDEWLTYARLFVEGDAAAVAAGYEPMANPSAAEIQAELTAAGAEVADVSTADAGVDQAQEAAAADAVQADALIGDLMDYLEFYLRRLDAPSQRWIMRRYGVKYYYRPGEPPDPEDAPVEPPPPIP
jgi:hypothetical protein